MQLDRYAAVNDRMLSLNNLTCTEYTYAKAVDTYLNTSWSSEAAEGGQYEMYTL